MFKQKQFEYMVQTVSTYKLEGTLEAYGDRGWELITTSIKESEKGKEQGRGERVTHVRANASLDC